MKRKFKDVRFLKSYKILWTTLSHKFCNSDKTNNILEIYNLTNLDLRPL